MVSLWIIVFFFFFFVLLDRAAAWLNGLGGPKPGARQVHEYLRSQRKRRWRGGTKYSVLCSGFLYRLEESTGCYGKALTYSTGLLRPSRRGNPKEGPSKTIRNQTRKSSL